MIHIYNLFVFLQAVCLWRLKVRLKQRSAVKTTKTGPVRCPTCPPHLETTTSLWSLMTNTSRAARSLPRSQVLTHSSEFYHLSWSSAGSYFLFWLDWPPGDDSIRMSQLNVGTATDVSLKITETDLNSLTATIRAPSGNEEPCLLKRLPNRHIGWF